MAEIENGTEGVAFQAALDRLAECGWSFEGDGAGDDRRAFEIVWCASRDWSRRQVGEALATQIDFDSDEE